MSGQTAASAAQAADAIDALMGAVKATAVQIGSAAANALTKIGQRAA
jgi:hypothetical protein